MIPGTILKLLEANMGIAIRSTLGESDLRQSIRAAVADVDNSTMEVRPLVERPWNPAAQRFAITARNKAESHATGKARLKADSQEPSAPAD